MAPEQLAGRPATAQSDLYALGLVLYEIFTGKRAFDAASVAEWRRVHAEDPPTSPSLHTADMDPAVERVILRCLEKDPSQRPRSAAQVALALPGGDPLAAALAAGETPSPEMVAAAGGEGALAPARAWMALGAFAVLLGAVIAISPASLDLGLAPMVKSPDVLRERAREIARRFGYLEPAADEVTWLERDYDPIRWLADHVPSTTWRRGLHERGSPVLLHSRRSGQPIVATSSFGVVTEGDPPSDLPGEIHVVVDSLGRLREMRAMPPRRAVTGESVLPFPESSVFEETGLDPALFETVAAAWVPPVPFDHRREWVGSRREAPEIPLRLSAATFLGRVVSVNVLGPWTVEDPAAAPAQSTSQRIALSTLAAFLVLVLATAGFFARRNMRLGRGDRRGAFRLAVVAFTLQLLTWLALFHPARSLPTLLFDQTFPALAQATFVGAFLWLMYMALEPYVRRRMPGLLVGWARVIEGRFLDPRVGCDALVGLVVGTAAATVYHLANGLPTWFSFSAQTTIPLFRIGNSQQLAPFAAPFDVATNVLLRSFTELTALFVCRLLVSRDWATLGILWLLFSAMSLGGENPALETPAALVLGFLFAYVTTRRGLLALVATWLVNLTLNTLPVGVGFGAWYAPYTIGTLVALLALAGWAFHTSLGGRSPFGSVPLDA